MTAQGMVIGLVRASHPGPSVVVTGLSGVLLVGLAAPASSVLLAAGAVLAGQLSIGWSNDWLDAARDVAVGRSDKPVVTGEVRPTTLRAGAFTAAACCVALSLATGAAPAAAHLVAVASAWGYNLGVKRTAWSWLPYAVSFGLLPVFLAWAAGTSTVPWRLVVAGGLLGVGAHVANALPDLEDDAATSVRGLPHRLGRRASAVLAPVLLLAATAVVAGSGGLRLVGLLVAGALAVAAGVVAVTRPASRLPFGLSMLVAAMCVVLLVTAGRAFVAA